MDVFQFFRKHDNKVVGWDIRVLNENGTTEDLHVGTINTKGGWCNCCEETRKVIAYRRPGKMWESVS